VALGVTLGIVIAVSGGAHSTQIRQAALGSTAGPSASGPLATTQFGDVATAPVSGAAGATPINLNQTAAEAANSMNCTLEVPANPLTAKGLETPWQLGDGCSMENAGTEGAFVEATILAPSGSPQVYNPLVITAGSTPGAAPTRVTVAPGSSVEISIGFNGSNLALTGAGAREGDCVDALGQSLIGQVSACNAVGFYRAADADIANGTLKVPALGTADDGQPCLTTRDFATIDQDPSDNVVSQYLINGNGQTEQATAANKTAAPDDTLLANGSDDALLAEFLDPANGCAPFTATDNTNPNGASASQALNELQAQADQTGATAVIPTNDEMVLVNGQFSIAKTNVYRSLADQPLLPDAADPTTVAADFCQNMVNIQPERNQLDMTRELSFATPDAATGDNLATFMGNRLSMSFVNLNCAKFGLANPVNVTLNGNGVATAVSYNVTQQTAKIPANSRTNPNAGQPSGTQARGQRHNRAQNPSGM
jgi:hypothetical protein